jgi:L-fucose mutarotase/ribose pyranase (RbsD/FucU family)
MGMATNWLSWIPTFPLRRLREGWRQGPITMTEVSAPRAVEAMLSVLPLDDFVDKFVFRMEAVAEPAAVPPVQEGVQGVVDRALGAICLWQIERHVFYTRAATAFAVVVTGETAVPAGALSWKKGLSARLRDWSGMIGTTLRLRSITMSTKTASGTCGSHSARRALSCAARPAARCFRRLPTCPSSMRPEQETTSMRGLPRLSRKGGRPRMPSDLQPWSPTFRSTSRHRCFSADENRDRGGTGAAPIAGLDGRVTVTKRADGFVQRTAITQIMTGQDISDTTG